VFELRLINRVPPTQGASISFVEVPVATVGKNISLLDYASQRAANSAEYYHTDGYTRVIPPSSNHPGTSSDSPTGLASPDFIFGNKTTLAQSVTDASLLFYRAFVGRGPQVRVKATSSNVTLTISSTQVSFNSTVITYTGHSTRYVVKKINDAADGLVAQLLYAGEATFSTSQSPMTVTTAGSSLYASVYKKVYAPEASTTDLNAARETIRASVELLIDGSKSSQVAWDIWVDSYDTDGFIVELYVSRKSFLGRTLQIRYNSINTSGVVQQSVVEVVNPEPYITETVDYDLTQENGVYLVSGLATTNYVWGLGLFSKTGSSVSVDVDGVGVIVSGIRLYVVGKTTSDLAAEINETFPSTLLAVALHKEQGILYGGSLLEGAYTVYPSGTPIPMNLDVGLLFAPDSRIHAKLPHDADVHSPWYPRISNGTFVEERSLVDASYGTTYGATYGGSVDANYLYSIPEYATQVYASDYGSPFRHVAREAPIVLDDRTLRSRRWPIESLANLTLRNGTQDISSSINDVDTEQGFLFLDNALDDYSNLALDYMYAERAYIYKGIDLNPLNNTAIVGKYVGLYVIPSQVGVDLWTSSVAVYHIISDTVSYIETQLENMAFSSGVLAHPLLVGIYQVVPTASPEDVVFTEIGNLGGGLSKEVTPIEEANFLFDVGRWDGEPFEAQGSIHAEIPGRVFADGDVEPPFTIDPMNSTNSFMDATSQWRLEEVEHITQRWVALGTAVIVSPGT